MHMLGHIALILVLIGAINWGLIGLADFNVVNYVNGMTVNNEMVERSVYVLVGLAAVFVLYQKYIQKQE